MPHKEVHSCACTMTLSRDAIRRIAVQAVQTCKGDIAAASKLIGKSQKFIKRWVNRYSTSGSVSDLPRAGRPQILDKASQRLARKLATTRKNTGCKVIAQKLLCVGDHPKHPSASTVRRSLHRDRKHMEYGKPRVEKMLPYRVQQSRLAFCRRYRDMSWKNVMVLDSKIFYLDTPGTMRMWHYKGHTAKLSALKDKRKIHVYAGACVHGVTRLRAVTGTTGRQQKYYSDKGKPLEGVGYREFIQVLRDTIVPQGKRLFGGQPFTLLMDRAPAHTPLAVKHYLEHKGVQVVHGWPGHSPDLNWIEDLWGILAHKMAGGIFQTVSGLRSEASKQWRSIPTSTLRACASSMRKRMRLCIQLKGGHTGY